MSRKSRWVAKRRQRQRRTRVILLAVLVMALLGSTVWLVWRSAGPGKSPFTVTEAEFRAAAERSLTKLCQFYTDLCLPGYVGQSLEQIHFVHQAEFDEIYTAAANFPPGEDVAAFTTVDVSRQIYFNVDYELFHQLPTQEDFLAAAEKVLDHEVVHQASPYYELPGSVVISLSGGEVFTATTVSGVALVNAQGEMFLNPADEAITEYLATPLHRSRYAIFSPILVEGPLLVESLNGKLGFDRQLIMAAYALYGWSSLAFLYGEAASPQAMNQLGLDEFWMGVNFLVLLNNAVVDLAGGEVDQNTALGGLETFLDSGQFQQP